MLKEMHTVLPAADLGRAQKFYHDMLDMDPTMTLEDGAMLHYGSMDSGFDIYETENAGTAKNTQMAWMTDNLDDDMRRLREKGVVFRRMMMESSQSQMGGSQMGSQMGGSQMGSDMGGSQMGGSSMGGSQMGSDMGGTQMGTESQRM
jgi:hypothetical protein